MNRARTISRRKGYLLTALAAAVLLAASSGTAYAQRTGPDIGIKSVKVDAANAAGTVAEGVSTKVTVTLTAKLPGTASATVDLVVALPAGLNTGQPGAAELTDGADLVLGRTENVAILAGTDSVSVALLTVNDLDAVDEKFVINVSGLTITDTNEDTNTDARVSAVVTGMTPATGKIDDDEDQTFVLKAVTAAKNIKENSTFEVSLSASPNRPANELVNIHVRAEEKGYALTTGVDGTTPIPGVGLALSNTDLLQTITVGTPENDENRDDDTVTLTGLMGTVTSNEEIVSESFTVLDVHQLPTAITGEAKDKEEDGMMVTSVTEGGKAYLFVTVVNKTDDRIADDEMFTLTPSIAGGQGLDARITPANLPFDGAGDGTDGEKVVGPFTIEALSDEDVGMESLMVSLDVAGDKDNGGGTSSGAFTIDIEDSTEAQISPKSQDEAYPKITDAIKAGGGDEDLNPGEMVEIMTSDLFTVAKGFTASYGASVEGDSVSASASGEMVVINALKAGESKVTITGTAAAAASSFMPDQTISNVASITFAVMVVDKKLVVTVEANPAEIMEGGTSTITATANRAVEAGDGAVEIGLEVVGDATLEPTSITIAVGSMSGSAMLTAAEDDDYADETVTVVATGSGIDAARQVAIAVMDNDEEPVVVDPEPENTIWPRPQGEAYPVITGAIDGAAGDDGLNPGDSFSVPASKLFEVMDGYEASYSASVDNGDVASTSVSGDSVTVMAAAAGEAKVTISGTSRMASSSFAPEQVATNMADITFLVTVVDKMLVVMLEMPANVMDGNIVEGESYDIKVSANRMVSEDTEVMIMRDRAGSDAGEDDYSVMSATIMAGYDSATAELMVTEDMLPDSGTDDNMGEQLVLFGMVNGEQTNALTFTIWDQAVPALPLFGQLLLALFLMLGGARLYRRRQG